MAIASNDRSLVERYFAAMHMGAGGEEEMVALFGDDAEYVEPFSREGRDTTHKGIAAIRTFFHESFAGPMGQGVKLTLHRLDLDGERLRSEWTCEIPSVPAPFSGWDSYLIRDGKIQRLEVHLHQPAAGR